MHQSILDHRTIRLLKQVDRKGEIGRAQGEPLVIAGWISFGPPRPEINNPYNCYRLTDEGKAELARLERAHVNELHQARLRNQAAIVQASPQSLPSLPRRNRKRLRG